jgi:hypothetical protein
MSYFENFNIKVMNEIVLGKFLTILNEFSLQYVGTHFPSICSTELMTFYAVRSLYYCSLL